MVYITKIVGVLENCQAERSVLGLSRCVVRVQLRSVLSDIQFAVLAGSICSFGNITVKFAVWAIHVPPGSVSLTIFRPQFKFNGQQAVVPCTKFCSDHCIRIEVRVKQNFHRIWIATEKPLVKRGQFAFFDNILVILTTFCNQYWRFLQNVDISFSVHTPEESLWYSVQQFVWFIVNSNIHILDSLVRYCPIHMQLRLDRGRVRGALNVNSSRSSDAYIRQ